MGRSIRRVVVCGLLLMSSAVWAAGALTPEEVFRKADPSVVLIRHLQGHGSGVVVSRDGNILTNHHVVTAPVPLTVHAKVRINGRNVDHVFTDVKVTKVHPEYDLALLSIEAPGAIFTPVQLARQAPAVGAACYVIGSPGGEDGEALRNSLTAGLVSAVGRQYEGLAYLQLSAPINPGNSGGAAVDSQGRLLGIVTFKLLETEGIGFAIPAQVIKPAEFVEPEKLKGDLQAAKEFIDKGNEYYALTKRVTDEESLAVLFEIASYLYHSAMRENPNSPAPYHNLGLVHYDQKEFVIARHYFQRAYELSPNDQSHLHMLGLTYSIEGQEEEARELWLKGAFLTEDQYGACAENASIASLKRKDFARAAYLVHMSLLQESKHRADVKSEIWREAIAEISADLAQRISAKQDWTTCSAEEMDAWAKENDALMAAESQRREEAAEAAQKRRAEFLVTLTGMVEAAEPAPYDWQTVKFPDTLNRAVPIYGGVMVAMSLKELSKVAIFNTLTGELSFLSTPTNEYLMAAGGDRLVLYHPSLRVLEAYTLPSLEKEYAKRLPVERNWTLLLMGLRNGKHAFVSGAESTQALARREYGILDLDTLRYHTLRSTRREYSHREPNRFRKTSYRDEIWGKADHGLNHVTLWCTSSSPHGFEIAELDLQTFTFTNWAEHTTYHDLDVTSDGAYVCTYSGTLIAKPDRKIKEYPNSNLFRVLDSNLFLQYEQSSGLIIRDLTTLNELASIGKLPRTPERTGFHPKWLQSELVMASGLTNRLVMIDPETSELHYRQLLPAALAPSAPAIANRLQILAGEAWDYDLTLSEGQTAKLEDGPEGCRLEGGRLLWDSPDDARKGVYEVLVSITDGDNVAYRVVKLLVR